MRDVVMSENGIAVLDPHNLFLFHNTTFAQMFGFEGQSMVGLSLDHMMEQAHTHHRGPRINAPTLQAWLDHVHARQRSAPHRTFEVDLHGGRWILVSEQVHAGGELIMLCTDITRQKRAELDLVKAHADLQRLAHTDELTGLPNRRHFLQQLDVEMERARRYRHPLCLAMLDLDHFKRVNDQFGHPAGDEVLRHFSRFLRLHLRTPDVIGRLGGEEFAVMLPETTLPDALFVLSRMVEQLNHETVGAVAPNFHYSFSGGVASAPNDGFSTSCKWLLASADEALYVAKSRGRHQIVSYQAGAALSH
ncbi:GGDEF domain-containing protein [Oxalobacteraceae bacterium A2-2]